MAARATNESIISTSRDLGQTGPRPLTERDGGEDEGLAAVDAAVPARVVQRIGHGATVAEQEEILSILVRLRSDAQRRQLFRHPRKIQKKSK